MTSPYRMPSARDEGYEAPPSTKNLRSEKELDEALDLAARLHNLEHKAEEVKFLTTLILKVHWYEIDRVDVDIIGLKSWDPSVRFQQVCPVTQEVNTFAELRIQTGWGLTRTQKPKVKYLGPPIVDNPFSAEDHVWNQFLKDVESSRPNLKFGSAVRSIFRKTLPF